MFNHNQKRDRISLQIQTATEALSRALFAFVHNLRLNNPRLFGTDEEARGFSVYTGYYYTNYAPVPSEARNRTIQRTVRSNGCNLNAAER